MFKKVLSISIACLMLCSTAFASGSNGGNKDKDLEVFLKTQDKAIKSYEKVIKDINKDMEKSEKYSGAFIDEKGNLNINVVGDINTFSSELNTDGGIAYKSVKHSYKELERINKLLIKDMVSLDISKISLNEKENRVEVYLKALESDKIDKIKALVKNDSAVEFFKEPDNLIPTLTATDVINGNVAQLNVGNVTIGFAAVSNATNKNGFLIPGHISTFGGAINDEVKYGGSVAGTVKSMSFGGTVDASFVECKDTLFSTYRPTKQFMNGDTYTSLYSGSYLQGQYVSAYGAVSGKQGGTILSTSISRTVSNTAITDFVECNYKAIKGDSGAGIVYYNYSGSGTAVPEVMGMQSFSSLVNGTTWDSTCTSYFSKVSNICSQLNIRGY